MNAANATGGLHNAGIASQQGYMYVQQSNAAGQTKNNAKLQNQTQYTRVGNSAVSGTSNLAVTAGMQASTSTGGNIMGDSDSEALYQLMVELFSATNREQALAELSRRRDQNPDLGVALWNAYGVMTILYQEIIAIYPLLNPPALTMPVSNRVCNSLALLQLVATHEQTRMRLLKANVPQLLYPFLSTTSKAKQYDNLRLTSLGVIGALVKYDNHEVISFFVATEFLPLCLKIMDIGSELCKVVATFIFQKIIIDDGGFHYVTSHPKRLHTVLVILNNVVNQMVAMPSGRLLKSVTKCLIRLADNQNAKEEMRESMSEHLRDSTFAHVLAEDVSYRRLIYQLLLKLA
ncbi:RNA-binding protein, CCR4-NOT complex subunit Rcd1 [Coemansia sp. RSA 989]|nr:RNA-binding protein, CCR4-NOT complex subunit Rcd1 [Coemansia sp. RSA 989]KAJ2629988.1 RNA-binding protein, CCR4-NOT complex subunit Rcd1 [Coemansia sp. RSA 1290]